MDESGRKGERLHKVLARAGVASRRACERLIAQGRVKVDGEPVTKMGVVVDPERHTVTFDGEPVRPEPPVHYLVYKPKGVVCTTRDQLGRTSVTDLVSASRRRRLFPVGRMEEDSEGLILVTNDGAFASRIASRRSRLRHVYHVRLRGRLTQEALDAIRRGVWLSDGRSGPMWVQVRRWGKKVSAVLCAPAARRHRLLRRAWARVGLQPDKVVRIRIGALTTHGLRKGTSRRLTAAEVRGLLRPDPKDCLTSPARPSAPGRRPKPPRGPKAGRREGRPPPPRRVVGP